MSKKTIAKQECEKEPLFVGSYTRDSAVSEYEKLADASLAIFAALKKLKKNKKENKD